MTRICILAGNYQEAYRFASSQYWDEDQWFYPRDPIELNRLSNFHVLVTGTAGHNVPEAYFNEVFELAKKRGRINRG